MMIAIAEAQDRMDEIAYKHYGTLENFGEVIEANIHLCNKSILDKQDQVYLPDYVPPIVEKAIALW